MINAGQYKDLLGLQIMNNGGRTGNGMQKGVTENISELFIIEEQPFLLYICKPAINITWIGWQK